MKTSFVAVARIALLVAVTGPLIAAQTCVSSPASLNFDGANDFVTMGDISTFDSLTSFTVECWFKTNLSAHRYLVSKWNNAANASTTSFVIATAQNGSGRIGCALGTGFSTSASVPFGPIVVTDGLWHHVAATRAISGVTSTVTVYVDGVFNTSYTFSPSPLNNVAAPLLIGGQLINGSVATSFQGNLDEVRIWNIARTQSQIQSTMNTILVGPQSGLIGYWRLDDGGSSSSAQITSDLSPTSASGTLGANTVIAADDPMWTTTDVAPLLYPGIGGLVGQANSPQARLEVNSSATGTASGPFFITVAQGGNLTFSWTGDPFQPCTLLAGPLNVANTTSALIGIVDIGTPCLIPAFSDVVVLFNGYAPPPYSLFVTTSSLGTLTQTFSLPLGLPAGPLMTVQGLMGTTTGFPTRLTAAFQIVL